MKSFVCLSLTLMLLAVIGVSSSEKSSEDLFASIFAPPSCIRACWYGIEPGVTTEEDLVRKLAELNLTYKTNDAEGVKYYGIQQEIYTKPFIEKGFGSPLIHVWDGVVNYIVLPVNIPLNLIQRTWGLPSKIEDGASIRMIYYEEKLYLEAELDEDAVTYVTMAASDVLAQTYVVPVENGGPPPMSSCAGVSQAICDFASPTFIPLLRDTFKSESCQRACWLGIEPDVTTQQEAPDILVANGLIPNEIQEFRAVSFKIEKAFPFVGESFNSGFVRFGYGKVSQIELPTNVTLEQIKSAYGIPDRIIDRDDNSFQIVYASEWLVFETSDSNPDQIFKMYITNWRWLTTEYIAQPDFSSFVTDCAQALFLCDLLPNVDAQVLKDTLTSASCARACWYGIEPGITSRAEVEQILASHQINYRVESFGGGLGNANDADTYMWLPQNDGFINNGISEAAIFFGNEIAVKIYLPVQIPVSTVTQAYGTADWVTVDSERTLYDAVYEDEGLVFNLSTYLSPDITYISLEPSEALADLYMPTRECVLSDPVCHQFLGAATPIAK